ncbi:MAG: hypothetical protein OEX77_09475 [Candidatus Bathyarchaeota archaeon]|nr:hypothetical protein [Candidatus Bathyarchaeota archaeon]
MSQFTDLAISLLTLGASMAVLAYASRYVIQAVEDFIEFTGLSETSVGFALLSVVTSTPELLVAIFAISAGTPSLSVGDLLGSNVFNVGVVVGVLMLTAGFLKECPQGLDDVADILLLSSVIPLVLVIVKVPTGFIGLGLLSIFAFSVYRQIRTGARSTPKSTPDHSGNNPQKTTNKPLTIFKILFGTLVILVTARFTVSSALEIAAAYSILPIFIGALVVAFGTSLPELSLSIMAVKHGRTHLASANAIGSNLTNLTLVLGIVFLSSFFSPFSVDITPFFEIIAFVLITSLIIWYHITKGGDCRLVGMVLILTYVIFQVVIILG